MPCPPPPPPKKIPQYFSVKHRPNLKFGHFRTNVVYRIQEFCYFFGKIYCKILDVLFIHNLWQKCLPPPKLNKLLRLYGPAYLHAGASIPPTTMALPHSHDSPSLSATPHPQPSPHPRKQFLDILYAILCNFMRVFSELWKLAVREKMTPKNEKYFLNGVGKTYCICKLRIKRHRASVASEKIF